MSASRWSPWTCQSPSLPNLGCGSQVNALQITTDLSQTKYANQPEFLIFRVLDYSLFMFGLVRGDTVLVGTQTKPKYAELGVYRLDGLIRIGIPQIEAKTGFLTRVAGLFVAGRVEFSVSPSEAERLEHLGKISAVLG